MKHVIKSKQMKKEDEDFGPDRLLQLRQSIYQKVGGSIPDSSSPDADVSSVRLETRVASTQVQVCVHKTLGNTCVSFTMVLCCSHANIVSI